MVETVIPEVGHQMLEQILVLTTEKVVGQRSRSKASGHNRCHDSRAVRLQLVCRKLQFKRPRACSPALCAGGVGRRVVPLIPDHTP